MNKTTINYSHFAAIGTDGKRPVVWGVGVHRDPKIAEQDALIEGEHEAREQCEARLLLRAVPIDAARYARIVAGDVDASDLWTGS